ncbi:MAG: hypothetical protein FWE09_06585 [Treponema sp.]|nr:hypothetical protein [Treponema sp.]
MARIQAETWARAEISRALNTTVTRIVTEYVLEADVESEEGPEELARIVETITITISQSRLEGVSITDER